MTSALHDTIDRALADRQTVRILTAEPPRTYVGVPSTDDAATDEAWLVLKTRAGKVLILMRQIVVVEVIDNA